VIASSTGLKPEVILDLPGKTNFSICSDFVTRSTRNRKKQHFPNSEDEPERPDFFAIRNENCHDICHANTVMNGTGAVIPVPR
jgi:hypothetical protein